MIGSHAQRSQNQEEWQFGTYPNWFWKAQSITILAARRNNQQIPIGHSIEKYCPECPGCSNPFSGTFEILPDRVDRFLRLRGFNLKEASPLDNYVRGNQTDQQHQQRECCGGPE